MDQAAAQPARASSAAPAHPITAPAPAHAVSSAPAHAGTVAHTAQPADFWTETKKPAVFWNAASATATTLAIAAAFLVPWIADCRQRKRRRKYAIAMLRPVYYEAESMRRLAKSSMKRLREVAPLLRENADPKAQAACDSLVFDAIAGCFVPSEMTLLIVRKLANATLPAYTANRSWLVDLEPQEAGGLQNAYTEAENMIDSLMGLSQRWVLSRDVSGPQAAVASAYAEAIYVSMAAATKVLRTVIGLPKSESQALDEAS